MPSMISCFICSRFSSHTFTFSLYSSSWASSFSSRAGTSAVVMGASSLSLSKRMKVSALCLMGLAAVLVSPASFLAAALPFLPLVGAKKYSSSRSSFLRSTSSPSLLLWAMSFFSSFFSLLLVVTRDLQKNMLCSIRVISDTKGCSSSFSNWRCLRPRSYSFWRSARSSFTFSWRFLRCSLRYALNSRSAWRNSSRTVLRSWINAPICLLISSRWLMISGRSPSCSLRPSMSSVIFSCTFFLASLYLDISS
mmetsp:Transcript_25990/g.41632  ORF Transcript_25990/g.41632 Transcript_25990/m.41632 type:complete len:251 (+) Transcript_25990:136-888(+)